MWLQLIAVISLSFGLITHCLSAEISTNRNTTPTSLSAAEATVDSPLIMYQQALNYLLGRNGTARSAEKAADLFKTLAQQNLSSAQHMLGNMYISGKGVEQNDLLAYKWLSLASRNNMQLAEAIQSKRKRLYERLQSSLSDQSLHKMELWITEWHPSDNDKSL
ncbi:hypothetical protein MNBD_GAMMA09-3745 [hydrothermal vent metagenome]|uniref:Sel1 repeat family protein n=1 Tax=hydrothermal vent metagenome TaxID=652676 RepID=A0A3B0X2M2_9ZZZZ